ncbi:MAG: glutamate racemase [Verrucomicrobia bacterium]|nr:glutamate racemase [Verrucomicrobiota bacterium]
MMANSRPIGVFDSGVGGLTVLREIEQILPREDVVYLGDTARMPYGNKSPETIVRYTLEGASFLLDKNIKLLIVACHTASSYGIDILQEQLPIPVIGVIQPGFELLMQSTRSMRIAILGTEATIRSKVYQNLIEEHYPKAKIFPVPCPLFAPMIEEGLVDQVFTKQIVEHYLSCLRNKKIDAALLACTHYPLIRSLIQETLGENVQLIEPARVCAEQAKEWLVSSSLANFQSTPPRYEFFSTDETDKFKQKMEIFFPVRHVSVFLRDWKSVNNLKSCNQTFT